MEHLDRIADTRLMTHLLANSSPHTTLVVGATGKTGRRVHQRLLDAGTPVRAASRSSEVRFDWEDPSTWAPALSGIDAAYVTYFPDLAIPGASDTAGEFFETAVSVGTRRLVLLSGRGEEGAQRAEVHLQESGADWTIVRCGFFAQNFSETFPDPIAHGVLALPTPDILDSFLDADDIADVVVESLRDDQHIGHVHDITGPQLLKLTEVAEILTEAIGREVAFVSMPKDAYVAEISKIGFPPDVATHIADVIELALDGRNAIVTNDIEDVLGRPARSFAEYARDAATAGAWQLPVVAAS